MLTQASSFGLLLALTILVLLSCCFLYTSGKVALNRAIALAMVCILVLLATVTDFPFDLIGLNPFWRDHALVSGAVVSLLLLSSGYLVFDVSVERAREARDEACTKAIAEMANDHTTFWISGLDLAPTSPRRKRLLDDVPDIKEGALATHRTLAVLAQLAMGLSSKEGLKVAENAIHAFRDLWLFITELEKTTVKLEIEARSGTDEYSPAANDALKKLQAAHRTARNSYADLLVAAEREPQIRETEREATSH